MKRLMIKTNITVPMKEWEYRLPIGARVIGARGFPGLGPTKFVFEHESFPETKVGDQYIEKDIADFPLRKDKKRRNKCL